MEFKEKIWRNSKMCALAGLIPPVELSDGMESGVDFTFKYIDTSDVDDPRRQLLVATPDIEELFPENFITTIGMSILIYNNIIVLGGWLADDEMLYYPDSFAVKHDIANVPPKYIPEDDEDKNLLEYLAEYKPGVSSLYAIGMSGHDPQSRKGLAQVLNFIKNFSLVGETKNIRYIDGYIFILEYNETFPVNTEVISF